MTCTSFLSKLTRRKKLPLDSMATSLNRCLTTFDLILIGLSSMIGSGIFVLTGTVVRNTAGSGTIISYLFAGLAAVLSALCYSEFGSRIPKTGSSYLFTYVALGEVLAFTTGWTMLLEYMLGGAIMGRSISATLDSLTNGILKNVTGPYLFPRYFGGELDVLAPLIVIIFNVIVALGVKTSSILNNILSSIVVIVIGIITVLSFWKGNVANWAPERGGFLPFGFGGVVTGAATCYFSYIGFDTVAVSAEETKNPNRSIPIAICVSLAITTVLYVITTLALTVMEPYYNVHPMAAFPELFRSLGLPWAVIVVGIGSLIAMASSLFMILNAIPRILYAMASDGLLFTFLFKVNKWSRVPQYSVLVTAIFEAGIALLTDIPTLAELISVGTLYTYMLVAFSVLYLRYSTLDLYVSASDDASKISDVILEEMDAPSTEGKTFSTEGQSLSTPILDDAGVIAIAGVRKKYLQNNVFISKFWPDISPVYAMILSCALMILLSLTAVVTAHFDVIKNAWTLTALSLLGGGIILCFLHLIMYVQVQDSSYFQVPLVPLVPMLSIWANASFMLMQSAVTWLRMVVWMVLGLLVYFAYGMRRSKTAQEPTDATERSDTEPEKSIMDVTQNVPNYDSITGHSS